MDDERVGAAESERDRLVDGVVNRHGLFGDRLYGALEDVAFAAARDADASQVGNPRGRGYPGLMSER
jgi:hypothetical protein